VRQYGADAWQKAKDAGKTKLNERQFYQARTESFKEYFGDWENERIDNDRTNKAGQEDTGFRGQPTEADTRTGSNARRVWRLDRDTGEPAIFYHGSQDDITAFDINHPNRKDKGWMGRGVYTTSVPFIADSYSNLKPGPAGRNTMALFAAVENPYVATIELKKKLQFAPQWEIDEFTDNLRYRGYDGVVLEFGDGELELMAFSPNQIKSATGNTGQFGTATDNILFSMTPSGEGQKRTAGAIPKGHPASLESIQGEVKGFLDKYSVIYTDFDTIDTSRKPRKREWSH
jgi:hypothetical protein